MIGLLYSLHSWDDEMEQRLSKTEHMVIVPYMEHAQSGGGGVGVVMMVIVMIEAGIRENTLSGCFKQ
jgi:hypothetical protein